MGASVVAANPDRLRWVVGGSRRVEKRYGDAWLHLGLGPPRTEAPADSLEKFLGERSRGDAKVRGRAEQVLKISFGQEIKD